MSDAARLARNNVIQTYVSLALAVPATTAVRRNGYVLVTSRLDHPFCNFATGFDRPLTTDQARKLAGSTKNRFWIFSITGDCWPSLRAELARHGFRRRSRLVQMSARETVGDPGPAPEEAIGPAKRLDVGRFMVGEFFPSAPVLSAR